MTIGEWLRGDPCERDGLPWCAPCRPCDDDSSQYVYITKGWGAAYHGRRNCRALIRGQARIERCGGTPAPIERVAVSTAKAKLHSACQVCLG